MPLVGPVKLTIQMPTRPGSVKLVDGNGLDWKYREAAIEANIQSVGHHALLIIT